MKSFERNKIIYIFSGNLYSGAEIVLERLIKSNLDNVIPVIITSIPLLIENFERLGVKVIKEENLSSLMRKKHKLNIISICFKLLKKFFKINKTLIKNLNPEIYAVHTNNLTPSVYILPSLIYCKIFRKNFVWMWTNHDLSYLNILTGEFLVKICLKLFDITFVVSNAVKSKFSQNITRTKVLYNGLDLQEFYFSNIYRKRFREKYKVNQNDILIGIVGIISERKGHELLLEAFSTIQNYFSNIYLFFIGKFHPEEESLKEKIMEYVEQNTLKVQLTGHISNINEVYSGLDIVVNSTLDKYSEPLGTTIYEAMACERLVLASNTGGTNEIIDDTFDGFLFKPDDVDDLKKKLIFIINNINNLEHIKINALKKVDYRFSLPKMVSQYNKEILIRRR